MSNRNIELTFDLELHKHAIYAWLLSTILLLHSIQWQIVLPVWKKKVEVRHYCTKEITKKLTISIIKQQMQWHASILVRKFLFSKFHGNSLYVYLNVLISQKTPPPAFSFEQLCFSIFTLLKFLQPWHMKHKYMNWF